MDFGQGEAGGKVHGRKVLDDLSGPQGNGEGVYLD